MGVCRARKENEEVMEQESYREFCASFWTYVRSEDGVDTRESRTQEVLKLRIEQVFLMEPHDLAAMLSCCVTARGRYVEFADQFADSEPAQIIAGLWGMPKFFAGRAYCRAKRIKYSVIRR